MNKTYYIASWNTDMNEGITKFVYDKQTDYLSSKILENKQHRTSFFARNNDYLFVLTEGLIAQPNTSQVVSYKMSEQGLVKISESSFFDSACPHIMISNNKKHLYVSGYYSGSLYVIDVDQQGVLSNLRATYTNSGSSIHPRQASSHLHYAITTPDETHILVCDLGTDEILSFKIDQLSGNLEKQEAYKVPLGYGPRHMVFSKDGKYIYVICELTYHLLVYSYLSNGKMEFINDVDLWPECPSDRRQCSAIKLSSDGKTLFTGNRGESYNAIEAFDLGNPKLPLKISNFKSVNYPRDIILLDDNYIAICNQHGNTIQFLHYRNNSFIQTGLIEDIAEPVSLIEY